MGKLQVLAISLAVAGLGFVGWLHEHDQRVRWQGKAEAQVEQLEKDQRELDGFRKVVAALDTAYAKERRVHELQLDQVKRVKANNSRTIDSLIHELSINAIDSATKLQLTQLGEVCQAHADTIFQTLTTCEGLRKKAEDLAARKDTIIFRVTQQRDNYKKLFEGIQEHSKKSTWETIGKASVVTGLITGILKLLGVF